MSKATLTIPPVASRYPGWVSELSGCLLNMTSSEQLHEEDNDAYRGETFVASALAGDENAFGELVEAYQNTIAQQMRRFSRDQLVIEELVHEVFVEAYIGLSSFKRRGPFVHWLRKIAVRVGYRYWKKHSNARRVNVDISSVQDMLIDGDAANTDASELLGDILQMLKPRDRLVLTLLYWDGCSVEEAAELAGWSRSMAKVQAHRARQRLKKLLEEQYDD